MEPGSMVDGLTPRFTGMGLVLEFKVKLGLLTSLSFPHVKDISLCIVLCELGEGVTWVKWKCPSYPL